MSNEKRIVKVESDELYDLIKSYESAHKQEGLLKKKADSLSTEIKEIAQSKWIELYRTESKNPGTIVIETESFDGKASITYSPNNRFVSVTDKNKDIIGSDKIVEEIEYSIDPLIYKKYEQLLSDFIIGSEQIESVDKLKFIIETKKYSIKKDVLENLNSSESDINDLFEKIKPVFSIKDVIIE